MIITSLVKLNFCLFINLLAICNRMIHNSNFAIIIDNYNHKETLRIEISIYSVNDKNESMNERFKVKLVCKNNEFSIN